MPKLSDYVKTAEAAGISGVARNTLREWASRSNMPVRQNPANGFRVFKLDSSNVETWDPNRDDLFGTLQEQVDHVKVDRSDDDVLYELLLKLGLDLCVPIQQREFAGKAVHSIGAGVLFACLDKAIKAEDVETLAHGIVDWHRELQPSGGSTVIFRDSAFADDMVKTNLAAILHQHGLDNVRSL